MRRVLYNITVYRYMQVGIKQYQDIISLAYSVIFVNLKMPKCVVA